MTPPQCDKNEKIFTKKKDSGCAKWNEIYPEYYE